MNSNDRERIWVHPDFKKSLKRQAVELNTSIVNLTAQLAKASNNYDNLFNPPFTKKEPTNNEKRQYFDFP